MPNQTLSVLVVALGILQEKKEKKKNSPGWRADGRFQNGKAPSKSQKNGCPTRHCRCFSSRLDSFKKKEEKKKNSTGWPADGRFQNGQAPSKSQTNGCPRRHCRCFSSRLEEKRIKEEKLNRLACRRPSPKRQSPI